MGAPLAFEGSGEIGMNGNCALAAGIPVTMMIKVSNEIDKNRNPLRSRFCNLPLNASSVRMVPMRMSANLGICT